MLWWLTSKWENTIPTITSDFPMVSKMGLFHKSCYEQIKSNGVYAFTHTVSLFSLSLSLSTVLFLPSQERCQHYPMNEHQSTLSYEWTPVTCSVWILPPRIRRQFRNRTVVYAIPINTASQKNSVLNNHSSMTTILFLALQNTDRKITQTCIELHWM